MGLVGLVQLTERLLNQTLQNSQENPQAHATKANAAGQNNTADNKDAFVPSSQNAAQDAGIFQVAQVSLFSAAADFFLTRTAPLQAQAAPTTAPAVTPPPPRQDAPNNAAAPKTVAANAAGRTTTVNVPATANAPAPAQTTQDVQPQLASLNESLAALGLSQEEITVIDRVAQLIKDFNPAAFTDLANQLQTLAQDLAPQTAQAAPANTGAANVVTVANGATPNAAQPAQASAGFTLQALSIQFAGANETVQLGNGSGKNPTTAEVSAFQLQVQAVTLTLNNNGTGAATQIQAPQAAAATATVPVQLAAAAAA